MSKGIQDLIQGYKRFRSSYFEGQNTLYQKLAHEGQAPQVAVIACSDSRVDPALVLDCAPGDLFVIRNVANLVPPCEYDRGYHGTSAALEFAICQLKVQHVIVFGHSQCGGIRAMLEKNGEVGHSFIDRWMQLAQSACKFTKKQYPDAPFEEQVLHCAEKAIVHSLENLKTFPWIQEKIKTQELSLHGWIFEIESGVIKIYDDKKESFELL